MEARMTRVVCYIRQSDEEGHKKDLSCPSQAVSTLLPDTSRARCPWSSSSLAPEFVGDGRVDVDVQVLRVDRRGIHRGAGGGRG